MTKERGVVRPGPRRMMNDHRLPAESADSDWWNALGRRIFEVQDGGSDYTCSEVAGSTGTGKIPGLSLQHYTCEC